MSTINNSRIRKRPRPLQVQERRPNGWLLFLAILSSIACSSPHDTRGMVQGLLSTPLYVYRMSQIPRVDRLFAQTPHRRRPAATSTTAKKKKTPKTTATNKSLNGKKVASKTPSKKDTSNNYTIGQQPVRKKKKKQRLTFSVMFGRLKEFSEEHGHCLVPPDYKDPELVKFTKSLRNNYRYQFQEVREKKTKNSMGKAKTWSRPMLSESKTKMLQSINFCWDVQNATWELRCKELQEFLEVNGHQPVFAENPTLAIWLNNQQREYRNWMQELPSQLTMERLDALEELGVFEDYRTRQEAWAQYYQYLVEYHQKHGSCTMSQDYQHPVVITVIGEDGRPTEQRQKTFALGKWCDKQRVARRHYNELHEEHDDDDFDYDDDDNDSKSQQKLKGKPTNKKKKKTKGGYYRKFITAERIRMLDALDFPWNMKETKWQTMLNRLKSYYLRHGHLKIDVNDVANRDLRKWLSHQRHHYNLKRRQQASAMTPSRIATMEETIPDFSWKYYNETGPSTEDWSNLFSAIQEKGIVPGGRAKEHLFDGVNPFSMDVKTDWTEQELIDLWNQEDEEEEDDDFAYYGGSFGPENGSESNIDYYSDMDSTSSESDPATGKNLTVVG